MGDGSDFKLSIKIIGVSTERKKHVFNSAKRAGNIVVLTVFLAG
tara:strand:+ start:474 stop:605 length:132 start_codon:yes stop_codon:yes gene_type:complete